MNNLTKTSFLLSRPYFLAVYSEIVAHLATAGNYINREGTSSQIQTIEAIAPLEVAYLQNQEAGVIELACWEMIQMGFIQVRDEQLEVVTYFKNTSHLELIEQAIFDFLSTPKTIAALMDDSNLQNAIAKHCETYRDSLISQGYVNADYKKYLAAGMSGLLILGLTFGKPLVGILAGYRYLLLLIGAVMPKASLAIAATAWLCKNQSYNHLTSKGKEYLADLEQSFAEVTPKLLSPPAKPNSNTSLLVAIYGLEVISDSNIKAYANLFDLFSTG